MARREQWIFIEKAKGFYVPLLISSERFSKLAVVEILLAHKVRLDKKKGFVYLEGKKKPPLPYIS